MQETVTRRNFLKNSAKVALATGAMGSVLAACGEAATTTTGNSNVTLTFWHTYNITSPENQTLVGKVIPAFNKKYPNIKVNSQDIPYGSMLQKLTASIAGGKGPDAIRSDIIWLPQLAKIGALVQVDDIALQRKDEFYPGPLATCTYKDHYYGLPLDTNTKVVIYNKDLAAKAGITDAPTSSDAFAAACVKVSGMGKNMYGYSEGGTYDWAILPWVWSFGGAITDDQFTKATGYINSNNSIASLQYLIDLYGKKGISPSILGSSNLGPSDAVGKGQSLYLIDGPWAIPSFQKTYPDLKIGLSLMPAGPNGHTASVVGGEDIAIMKATKYVDAAKNFMQYMTNAEAQLLMGPTGQMPVLKSVANDASLPDYFKIYNQQLETAKPRTVSPNYPKISTILGTAFDTAFRKKQTVKAALDSAAQQIDPLLAE